MRSLSEVGYVALVKCHHGTQGIVKLCDFGVSATGQQGSLYWNLYKTYSPSQMIPPIELMYVTTRDSEMGCIQYLFNPYISVDTFTLFKYDYFQ